MQESLAHASGSGIHADNYPHSFSMRIVTIAAAILLFSASAHAEGAVNPEALLASKGLVAVGKAWTSKLEIEFRDRLDALDAQEKRAVQAQKKLDATIEKNESARLALVNAITTQSQIQTAIATATGAAKSQLQADLKQQNTLIDQLKPQYIDAKVLAESPGVKLLVVDVNNSRAELALNLLWLQSHSEPLNATAHALADDPQVAKAVTTLGMQLAPVKASYLDAARISRVEPIALSDRNHYYRESGFYRFSALLNRSIPVTFSFRESSDPVVLPASVAQNAGLKFDSAKTTAFTASDKRKLQVSKVSLSELRIGKFVWHDVEAIILPPEAEDLGAQLSPNSLSGHRVAIDANQLRLNIEAKP